MHSSSYRNAWEKFTAAQLTKKIPVENAEEYLSGIAFIADYMMKHWVRRFGENSCFCDECREEKDNKANDDVI